jgi:HAD superfamily hydrolase (TIGR01509 family)
MKTVIFDMDGILIESEHVYTDIENTMLDELGLDVSDEIKKTFLGAKMDDCWEMIKDVYDADFNVADIVKEERRRYIACLNNGDIQKVDGAHALLTALFKHGYNLALGTASKSHEAILIMKQFDYYDFMQTIVTCEDVIASKPAPDIYLKAAKDIGTNPHHCVVIEDSKNGIAAAKAANMKCIALKNAYNSDYSKADIVVSNLNKITINMIERL